MSKHTYRKCDICGKNINKINSQLWIHIPEIEIERYDNTFKVFSSINKDEDLDFCSYDCFIKYIRKIQSLED